MEKSLKELNMLDRFLFAEAMEDPETMQMVLEIILGREIVLKYLPQTEKEFRGSALKRFVKVDVYAQDEENTIYDAEVQKKNTGNLPKRSRFYQGMIDHGLLQPGESDFNQLNNIFIIMIAPFDLFGKGRYMYSFQMRCNEESDITLGDGAARIFLNTHGKDDENVRPELRALLRYMEHSDKETCEECNSERIHRLHDKIQAIKENEDVEVRYMQAWEEKAIERKEALEEGRVEGANSKLKELVSKKVAKRLSAAEIADLLEEDVSVIEEMVKAMKDE